MGRLFLPASMPFLILVYTTQNGPQCQALVVRLVGARLKRLQSAEWSLMKMNAYVSFLFPGIIQLWSHCLAWAWLSSSVALHGGWAGWFFCWSELCYRISRCLCANTETAEIVVWWCYNGRRLPTSFSNCSVVATRMLHSWSNENRKENMVFIFSLAPLTVLVFYICCICFSLSYFLKPNLGGALENVGRITFSLLPAIKERGTI